MRYYLGAPEPVWAARVTVPLFISRRRTARYKKMKRARCNWAMDSGGYTELDVNYRWTITARQYVGEVRRAQRQMGRMDWAAIMDWMVEPWIIKKTALSVREHQHRTTQNLLELQDLAPEVPWAPVVQGWEIHEYLEHVAMYEDAGVDLTTFPTVGVGSVCRRQGMDEAGEIFGALRERIGHRLHAFGLKRQGLRRFKHLLASADSMAWSKHARHQPTHEGCVRAGRTHRNCANCIHYALRWRRQTLGECSENLP